MGMELLLAIQSLQKNWAKIYAQVTSMLATFISPSPSKVSITTSMNHATTTMVPVKTFSIFFYFPKIKVAISNTIFILNAYEKKLVNRISAYGIIEKLDI